MVARAFYAGPCPPKDSPQNHPARGKWEKVDTNGLGVVILDSLTDREWVKEDELAEELKIAPKLLRRALRFFEEEHILRREHRKEGKRAQNKDVVVLATKAGKQEGQEGVGPSVKARLHSYCAIDYPSFLNMLSLRLYRMRQKLKSELEDGSPLMNYICSQCGSQFTSLDFKILLDRETGRLQCDECGTQVQEQFGTDGQTGTTEDRKKRREAMRALLHVLEKELKVIFDQLTKVKTITPPDYGTLTDWARERAAAAKRGHGGLQGRESGGSQLFEIELPGLSASFDGVARQSHGLPQTKKALPPWMMRQGMQVDGLSNHVNVGNNDIAGDSKVDMTGDESNAKDMKMSLKKEIPVFGASYDSDAHFKKYVEEVKRLHAYATAVKAEQQKLEQVPEEKVSTNHIAVQEAHENHQAELAVKTEWQEPRSGEGAATKEDGADFEDAVEPEGGGDDDIQWEDAGTQPMANDMSNGEGTGDEQDWEDVNTGVEYDAEAAHIADMESDAVRTTGWA